MMATVMEAFAVEQPESAVPRSAREVAQTSAPSEDLSWKTYPRSRFDLVKTFLGYPDSVTAARLFRHVVLNPEDRVLSQADRDILTAIVDFRASALKEPMEHYRRARFGEMRAIVEESSIEPVEPPRMSEEWVRAQARLRAREGETEQEAYERVQSGMLVPAGRQGFIVIKGKRYLYTQFKSLPQSDAMWDDIKSFSMILLYEACTFFESRGLLSSTEAGKIYSETERFGAGDLRK